MGPGGAPLKEGGMGLADVISGSKRPKVVYLVGETPFFERPDCDFLIVQDTYLPSFAVDAFLPASSFVEAEGTLVNLEGRVQEVVQAEALPEGAVAGFMRPDWLIFSDLAHSLNCDSLSYKTSKDVLKDIQKAVPDFPPRIDRKPRRMRVFGHLETEKPEAPRTGEGNFLLVAEPAGYRHRGRDISSIVGGLKELALEDGFRMHPEDVASLGLKDGDGIKLSFEEGRTCVKGPVKSDRECPKGTVYFTQPVVFGGLGHRRELLPLYLLKQNPMRVSVSRE